MMRPRALGSVLMILGTSVGAGMLALPVAAAQQTFSLTLLMLIVSWLLMTGGALSLLEVNLWLKPGANMISMAEETLGVVGKVISWVIYLALLYSLLCAYLSGTADVLHGLLFQIGLSVPTSVSAILSLMVLVTIIYCGIGSVDKVNRGLMSVKFLAYILLLGLIVPFAHVSYIGDGAFHYNGGTMMVMMTSFGYAIIVPSLRSYLDSNVSTLRRVIWVGSALPLVIYSLWVFVIQSVIVRTGPHGLFSILHSTHVNTALMNSLTMTTRNPFLSYVSRIFVSICVMTSFLGVSVCMFDFMVDGLQVKKEGKGKVIVAIVSFLPPLIVVLCYPSIFILALSYAGICCVILLIIMPVLMLYVGRYRLQKGSADILPGGKFMLFSIMIVAMSCLLA